jgi:hypothetical protein
MGTINNAQHSNDKQPSQLYNAKQLQKSEKLKTHKNQPFNRTSNNLKQSITSYMSNRSTQHMKPSGLQAKVTVQQGTAFPTTSIMPSVNNVLLNPSGTRLNPIKNLVTSTVVTLTNLSTKPIAHSHQRTQTTITSFMKHQLTPQPDTVNISTCSNKVDTFRSSDVHTLPNTFQVRPQERSPHVPIPLKALPPGLISYASNVAQVLPHTAPTTQSRPPPPSLTPVDNPNLENTTPKPIYHAVQPTDGLALAVVASETSSNPPTYTLPPTRDGTGATDCSQHPPPQKPTAFDHGTANTMNVQWAHKPVSLDADDRVVPLSTMPAPRWQDVPLQVRQPSQHNAAPEPPQLHSGAAPLSPTPTLKVTTSRKSLNVYPKSPDRSQHVVPYALPAPGDSDRIQSSLGTTPLISSRPFLPTQCPHSSGHALSPQPGSDRIESCVAISLTISAGTKEQLNPKPTHSTQ